MKIQRVKPYKYLVESNTNKRRHTVIERENHSLYCDCKGYKYRGTCRHITMVENKYPLTTQVLLTVTTR